MLPIRNPANEFKSKPATQPKVKAESKTSAADAFALLPVYIKLTFYAEVGGQSEEGFAIVTNIDSANKLWEKYVNMYAVSRQDLENENIVEAQLEMEKLVPAFESEFGAQPSFREAAAVLIFLLRFSGYVYQLNQKFDFAHQCYTKALALAVDKQYSFEPEWAHGLEYSLLSLNMGAHQFQAAKNHYQNIKSALMKISIDGTKALERKFAEYDKIIGRDDDREATIARPTRMRDERDEKDGQARTEHKSMPSTESSLGIDALVSDYLGETNDTSLPVKFEMYIEPTPDGRLLCGINSGIKATELFGEYFTRHEIINGLLKNRQFADAETLTREALQAFVFEYSMKPKSRQAAAILIFLHHLRGHTTEINGKFDEAAHAFLVALSLIYDKTYSFDLDWAGCLEYTLITLYIKINNFQAAQNRFDTAKPFIAKLRPEAAESIQRILNNHFLHATRESAVETFPRSAAGIMNPTVATEDKALDSYEGQLDLSIPEVKRSFPIDIPMTLEKGATKTEFKIKNVWTEPVNPMWSKYKAITEKAISLLKNKQAEIKNLAEQEIVDGINDFNSNILQKGETTSDQACVYIILQRTKALVLKQLYQSSRPADFYESVDACYEIVDSYITEFDLPKNWSLRNTMNRITLCLEHNMVSEAKNLLEQIAADLSVDAYQALHDRFPDGDKPINKSKKVAIADLKTGTDPSKPNVAHVQLADMIHVMNSDESGIKFEDLPEYAQFKQTLEHLKYARYDAAIDTCTAVIIKLKKIGSPLANNILFGFLSLKAEVYYNIFKAKLTKCAPASDDNGQKDLFEALSLAEEARTYCDKNKLWSEKMFQWFEKFYTLLKKHAEPQNPSQAMEIFSHIGELHTPIEATTSQSSPNVPAGWFFPSLAAVRSSASGSSPAPLNIAPSKSFDKMG